MALAGCFTPLSITRVSDILEPGKIIAKGSVKEAVHPAYFHHQVSFLGMVQKTLWVSGYLFVVYQDGAQAVVLYEKETAIPQQCKQPELDQ